MSEKTRLCRDCGRLDAALPHPAPQCAACGSSRVVEHPELARLAIAHVDCDAFYASGVEKRDRPELANLPVIVGGGMRGVVLTCCYVARRSGVRSAMAMAHAMRLCPDATVIRPDMEKYRSASHRIRELMMAAAPVVEQVSIDEAYLDLGEAGDGEPPARALARLALLIERRVGVTVSIGLAPNKMLAKVASDLGKPRGFRIIGESDAIAVLGPMKVRVLPGVGPVMAAKLEAMGFHTVADLRAAKDDEMTHRFGRWGGRLVRFARGEDGRRVGSGGHRAVTIGAERTFERDLQRSWPRSSPNSRGSARASPSGCSACRDGGRGPHPQTAPRRRPPHQHPCLPAARPDDAGRDHPCHGAARAGAPARRRRLSPGRRHRPRPRPRHPRRPAGPVRGKAASIVVPRKSCAAAMRAGHGFDFFCNDFVGNQAAEHE